MADGGDELTPTELEPDTTAAVGDDAVADEGRGQRSREWARRYPPLLSMLAALLIAVFVLPSSLNLPEDEVQQTLEYAPVPPEDDEPPPPQGNLSSLGLGESGSLSGDGEGGGGTTVPPALEGLGETPVRYRCVGNPPRQTEDPLAPPCVQFFEGDNFCATYQGVTCDEIRIVLYRDGNIQTLGTSRGTETCPQNKLVDLVNDKPTQDECHDIRMARLWQKYFNQRYQTYLRYVHFFVYFGASASSTTPETRVADAAEVYRRVKPFATIDQSQFEGGGDSFVDTLARRGVLNFGSFIGQDARFFQEFPKLIWGYPPSNEIAVKEYADVLCNNYVPHKVQHSRTMNGQPRKFGLVYTTDPGFETLRRFKDAVMTKFKACGGELATAPRTFPKAGYTIDAETTNRYAIEAMQAFQQAGVTTIIWPGGLETKFSSAAATLGYFPEWILAGDGLTDNEFAQQSYQGAAGQNQQVWQYAAVTSAQPLIPENEQDRICFQALRSVDPNVPQQDALRSGCDMYDNLRQLFIGIQVAGPRLGPTSIDRGFHAIPAVATTDLRVPACYYLPGDYTCIKDYALLRWNPNGDPEDERGTGCYEIVGNRRRLVTSRETGNVMDEYNTSRDPCQNFGSSLQINENPPDPNQL